MKLKSLGVLCALALFGATACQKSSPATPTDTGATSGSAAVTDASTGITLTVPQLTAPTANQQFKFTDQPLTLTIKNGAHTGTTPATYTFEIATDSGFATKVYTKAGVAEGAGGSTSLKIDTLPGPQAKNYFWHAQTVVGSAVSQFTTARGFAVGAQLIINAPAVSAPTAGGTLGSNGSLVVVNSTKQGQSGTLQYRFDVSDTAGFGNIVFTSTTPEGSGVTGVSMTSKLTSNGIYYWRVIVTDPASSVQSPYSAVTSFKYVPFQMTDATIVSSPPDLGSWPETSQITSVTFTNEFLVDFDRRDGPNRWSDTPFGDGSLEYTLGMCGNINNHWYCSAVVQFWYGRDLAASGSQYNVAAEWFYDPGRWGPMVGYQPQQGETVGLFAASGNLRNNTDYTRASCPTICERTNVAFVQWGTSTVSGVSNAVKTALRTLRR